MSLKEFKTTALAAMTASLSVFGASSCVNQEYDLNKGIDMGMTVDGNISAPLGSTEKIMIGDFLEIDGSDGLVEDTEGNLSLSFAGDAISETIDVPAIDLKAGDFLDNQSFSIPPIDMRQRVEEAAGDFGEYAGMIEDFPLDGIGPLVIDDLLEDGTSSIGFSLDIDAEEIAAAVSEIGTIRLDAPVGVTLYLDSPSGTGAVTLRKGLTVTFPDFISVEASDTRFSVTDGHVLTLRDDLRASEGSPLEVGVNITEMDLEALKSESGGAEGFVEDGGRHFIRVDRQITMSSLVFEVLPLDFGSTLGDLPLEITCGITMDSKEIELIGATLVLDPDLTIEDQMMETGGLPEFLTGEGSRLDIWNPVITLEVDNSSPVAIALSATLTGYDAEGVPVTDEPIAIGTPDKPVIIRSLDGGVTCRTTIYISARPVDIDEVAPMDEYFENIVIADLPDLIAGMPELVEIGDISAKPWYDDGNKFTRIFFDRNGTLQYGFDIDYSIDVPLAFGEDLAIEYPYDITGMNGIFDPEGGEEESLYSIYVDKAEISMNFVNTLPIGMSVSAEPIDARGEVLPASSGIEAEILAADGSGAVVPAGTLDNPSSAPVTIILRASRDAVTALDGFRLDISGTSSAETAGTPLNTNQYIQLTDISVNLDGGVDIEMEDIVL